MHGPINVKYQNDPINVPLKERVDQTIVTIILQILLAFCGFLHLETCLKIKNRLL